MAEETKISPDPTPEKTGSTGRPTSLSAAAPAKKFPRAEDKPKRGPGRPPKPPVERGPSTASAVDGRAKEGNSAAASAPSLTAKPDPGATPALMRGLLQMLASLNGAITHFALKIPIWQSMQLWQFTEAEIKAIEAPGGAIVEKYAPMLEEYGIEFELAGVLLPILTAKVFAILAAKQLLDAQKTGSPAVASSPASSGSVTEIRPPATKRETAAAVPDHTQDDSPVPTPAASPEELPSAFAHSKVDTDQELVVL